MLLPECSNIEFNFDVMPPKSKFLNIKFDITENNGERQYEINAAIRSSNSNILNESGEIISDDD